MANGVRAIATRLGFLYLVGITVGLLLMSSYRGRIGVSKLEQSSSSAVGRGGRMEEERTQSSKRILSTKNPFLVLPDPIPPQDLGAVFEYHAQEEKWCQLKIENRSTRVSMSQVNSSRVNWCPCVPSGLKGRILVNKADDSDWDSIAEAVGTDVRAGGEWLPENCVPHTRLAIIIPCRDRESHLRVLLRHLYPILKRQMTHFRIFVVDQRYPMIFNKAAIMNIGFLEAQKRFPFDCVIFHDVDMLLEDDRALMTCGPNPRHYARALDKFDYRLYPTFGGVVSLTADMFRKVNGYSLRYFGWGGEDDDMWSRVGKFWSIFGMPSVVSRYSTIYHHEDATNQRNPQRHALIDVGYKRNKSQSDGLSDVAYDVNGVEVKPLYTRIEVDINTTVLHYPQHKTFRYQRVPGFCEDPDVILTSDGASWPSCRFHCDTYVGQTCFGFSHVTGKCTLIRTVCNLSPSSGWTYVKEGEFSAPS